jgi:hypothetical protein
MGYQDVTEGALEKSGLRATKFTPERIQQIKDLIARGTSGEEIAALIGVTVGTLKVTSSRLGISLRRPRSRNGTGLLPLRAATRLAKTAGADTATFTISLQYKGTEQRTELPLTLAMIAQLALEASCRDQKISEFAGDLLQAVTEKGLFQEVLDE